MTWLNEVLHRQAVLRVEHYGSIGSESNLSSGFSFAADTNTDLLSSKAEEYFALLRRACMDREQLYELKPNYITLID